LVLAFANCVGLAYSTYGLNYVLAGTLGPQLGSVAAIVAVFASMMLSGSNDPFLKEMHTWFGGRGWLFSSLSPIRWYYGFAITFEVATIPPAMKAAMYNYFMTRGYDMCVVSANDVSHLESVRPGICSHVDGAPDGFAQQRFIPARVGDGGAWIFSSHSQILLGIFLRAIAVSIRVLRNEVRMYGWLSLGKATFADRSLPVWILWLRVLLLAFMVMLYWYALIHLILHAKMIDDRHFLMSAMRDFESFYIKSTR